MIKYLEKESDFEGETRGRCLIDFYADWCGPCKMMGSVLEEIEKDIDMPILKVNTDKCPNLATKMGVMSIPTLIIMDGSTEVDRHIGFMSKEEISKFVK